MRSLYLSLSLSLSGWLASLPAGQLCLAAALRVVCQSIICQPMALGHFVGQSAGERQQKAPLWPVRYGLARLVCCTFAACLCASPMAEMPTSSP